MDFIKLSPSALNLFNNCPRCFWLEKNRKIKRPRGIFPSLPGGMDLVIKRYFDTYREQGLLPPELRGKIEGDLFGDIDKLEKWRSWRATDLIYNDPSLNAALSGALDDCLVDDGFYIPLDYKTRGSELKEDPRKYYQTQLDCYTLILDATGHKTKGLSYLVYYWPKEVRDNGMVEFTIHPIRIETSIDSAKKTFEKAVNTLRNPLPPEDGECEYCNWLELSRNI
ncbi:MAG: PD-(D/E)XK nuclease family protein [bacterium]